jgi:hypothetical protein
MTLGTPAPIVDRLNSEPNKALADLGFIQRLRDVGMQPMPLTVPAFSDFISHDLGRLSGAKAE